MAKPRSQAALHGTTGHSAQGPGGWGPFAGAAAWLPRAAQPSPSAVVCGSGFSVEPAFCDQIQPIPVGLEASKIFLPDRVLTVALFGEWDGVEKTGKGKLTISLHRSLWQRAFSTALI